MNESSTVWDLGEVAEQPVSRPATSRPRSDRPARPDASRPRTTVRRSNEIDWVASLAMVAPGLPDLLHGRRTNGLFFLSMFGLVGALGWALYATLDRLGPTLALLGLPPEAAVWGLFSLFGVGALLHLGSVATSTPARLGAPPPPVSAVSSAIVPGWGQLMNGDVSRAFVFAAGAWTCAGLWLLASPWLNDLLTARNLILPPVLTVASADTTRWAATAVVWALAVYDAWERASAIRSS
jgi:TM2 domain-containing membrane protein YozV